MGWVSPSSTILAFLRIYHSKIVSKKQRKQTFELDESQPRYLSLQTALFYWIKFDTIVIVELGESQPCIESDQAWNSIIQLGGVFPRKTLLN
jgi:hypothetical protein